MKFDLKNANQIGWEGLKAYIYNEKEDFANASAALFEVTGSHGKIKTTLSDRVYFVVSGKGEFDVNGEKVDVEKNDVIIIPKNTIYDYRSLGGTLELFLVHTPAYDPEFEEKIDG